MDNLLTLSVSGWGITFSTAPFYFNMSWGFIITGAVIVVAHKVIKAKRG